MKALLLRTGSSPVHSSPLSGSSSPKVKVSFSDHDFVPGILFSGKSCVSSCLHLEKKKKGSPIRRTRSEADVIRSVNKVSCCFVQSGSQSFPVRVPEEEVDVFSVQEVGIGGGTSILKKKNLDRMIGIWRESDVLEEEEEVEYIGGGFGKGRNVGGGNGGGSDCFSGGNADQSNMIEYYQKLLEANPGNPLILRNYGKYLHEVKGDMVKAEDCYSRAILAVPGDAEVLSLYGKLIWESSGDAVRAESYFDQAVQAAPDDCYVMGSYANFLWSAEEDDEEEEEEKMDIKLTTSSNLVEAC